jgi:hypothetical protein
MGLKLTHSQHAKYPYCYRKYLQTNNTGYLPSREMDEISAEHQEIIEKRIASWNTYEAKYCLWLLTGVYPRSVV